MNFYQQLALICVGSAVNLVLSMYLLRWRKQKEEPREELLQIQRDLVVVRGQIKYIQGVLNGKHWKRED